jgi:hypothetical protein
LSFWTLIKLLDPNIQRGKETANHWPSLWGKKEIGNVLVVVVQRVIKYSKFLVRSSGHYLDVLAIQQEVSGSLQLQFAELFDMQIPSQYNILLANRALLL